MDGIKVVAITEEQRENAAKMMLPEVAESFVTGAPITALAAICGNTAVGVLSGFAQDGCFRLRSLYVHPDYRRRGAATALVGKLSELLSEMSLPIAADYTLQAEDNETLEPFLLSVGFREEAFSYPSYAIFPLHTMRATETGAAAVGDKRVLSFEQVPSRLLRAASNRSIQAGHPLPEGGLLSPKIRKEVSQCIASDSEIFGYVVVEAAQTNMLLISAIRASIRRRELLWGMLAAMIKQLDNLYPIKTRIAILIQDERAMGLLRALQCKSTLCSKRFTLMREPDGKGSHGGFSQSG